MNIHRTRRARISGSALGVAVPLIGSALLISLGCQSEPDRTVRVAERGGETSVESVVAVAAASRNDLAHGGPWVLGSAEGPAAVSAAGRDGQSPEAGAENASPLLACSRSLPASEYVDFASVPVAPMGGDVGRSRFDGAPGYEAPEDPERDAVLSGRRDAPWVEGDLEGGVRGFDRLIGEILAGLDATDQRALTYLRISGHDYEKFCWPEFPQSRPITNIPASESWFFLEGRCRSGITAGLGRWGGQGYAPVWVEFAEGRADYRNFTLWKGTVIYAQRPGSREVVPIDFAEVAIERNGIWKVYAYKD